jgi:CRP/FNR family nitrogen fixation transcriptional regulator
MSAFGAKTKSCGMTHHVDWNGVQMTGVVRYVMADQTIFDETCAATSFYRLLHGVARTCRLRGDGARHIAAFPVAGEIFGYEIGRDYTVSAETVTNCTLVAYHRQSIEIRAASDPALAAQMLSHVMRNAARSESHSFVLGRRCAAAKVAAFLREWVQIGTPVITLAMSRQDMADYLGLTVETVSRSLTQMERDGIIRIMLPRAVRLIDPAALRALAS